MVEKNGSNYILVYLPSHRNYRNSSIDSFFWKYFKGPAENHSPNHYQDVINLVKANNITLIDLHEELFKDLKDPYSVAPYGKYGHFNEFGYKLVAKKIYEKLNKPYRNIKKNIVGVDIMPQLPKKPDIKAVNSFEKNINEISKNILRKIHKDDRNWAYQV